MRRLLVTLAVAALILPATASARRLNPISLGGVTGSVQTDGRYAVWVRGAVVRVYDTTTGQKRDFTQSGCPGSFEKVVIGGGRLMFVCSPGDVAEVVDIATGASTPLMHQSDDPVGIFDFEAVGSEWVRGAASGYHYSGVDSFTALPGNTVPATGRGRDKAGYIADLDELELWRRLCAPLAREPNPDNDGVEVADMFLPFLSRGSYGLTESRKGLLLERCGSRRRVVLSRAATSFDLRPAMVAWVAYDTVHVRNLISGRDWTWSERHGTELTVALTDRHVFISESKGGRRRVLVQRRPR